MNKMEIKVSRGGTRPKPDHPKPENVKPPSQKSKTDITALTREEIAKLLQVGEDVIQRHMEQGAPAGEDGTINLIFYAAWLNRRLQNGD